LNGATLTRDGCAWSTACILRGIALATDQAIQFAGVTGGIHAGAPGIDAEGLAPGPASVSRANSGAALGQVGFKSISDCLRAGTLRLRLPRLAPPCFPPRYGKAALGAHRGEIADVRSFSCHPPSPPVACGRPQAAFPGGWSRSSSGSRGSPPLFAEVTSCLHVGASGIDAEDAAQRTPGPASVSRANGDAVLGQVRLENISDRLRAGTLRLRLPRLAPPCIPPRYGQAALGSH
jgi:hypothetical protein